MRALPAALVLAIPAAALGGLIGLATSPAGSRQADPAACAQWAREFRAARDDLSAALRAWREDPPPGVRRPPRPDDVRARVADLAEVRPDGCTPNGRPG